MPNPTPIVPACDARGDAAIAQAAQIIRAGGLVAFPTETVYGLGANALDASAVAGIYRAKRRSPDDPCIVHIADLDEWERVSTSPRAQIEALAAAFWPGPLSVIVPKAAAIPLVMTAQREAVAVRIPRHPVALALIRAAGVPIAAPSANTFEHTSPTTAQHVWDDLHGRIDLILDGGATTVGIESTVLDLSGAIPTILRPGGVSLDQLRAVLPEVIIAQTQRQVADHTPAHQKGAISPGLLARHYAPNAIVMLFDGPRERVLAEIGTQAQWLATQGVVGLLLTDDDLRDLALAGLATGATTGIVVASLGASDDLAVVARRLFAGLRTLEDQQAHTILIRNVDAHGHGLGLAIQDRLIRAAGGRIIQVAAVP